MAPAVAVIGVAGFAACGVPTDQRPREISRSPAPVEPPEDDPASTGPDQPGEDVTVQFLHHERDDVQLVPVRRTVSRPRTDTGVLEALLLRPPTEDERASDITTAIPGSTTLAGSPERVDGVDGVDGVSGDVLVVDLSSGLFDVRGDELRSAYAQIVCTVTRIDGVRAVRFEVEGAATPALDGDGEATDRPLRCQDYAGLLPRPAPAPG